MVEKENKNWQFLCKDKCTNCKGEMYYVTPCCATFPLSFEQGTRFECKTNCEGDFNIQLVKRCLVCEPPST